MQSEIAAARQAAPAPPAPKAARRSSAALALAAALEKAVVAIREIDAPARSARCSRRCSRTRARPPGGRRCSSERRSPESLEGGRHSGRRRPGGRVVDWREGPPGTRRPGRLRDRPTRPCPRPLRPAAGGLRGCRRAADDRRPRGRGPLRRQRECPGGANAGDGRDPGAARLRGRRPAYGDAHAGRPWRRPRR